MNEEGGLKPIRAAMCAAICVLLLATACGQYPNVHRRAQIQAQLAGSPSPSTGPSGAPGLEANGPRAPASQVAAPTQSTVNGSGSSPGSAQSEGAPTSGPSGTAVPSNKGGTETDGALGENTGSSKTWGKTVVIGLHAPITGTGPTHLTSLKAEKALYWRFGNDLLPVRILGRRVRVVVRDDRGDPERAVDACRQLVQKEHAFLLVGLTGPGQVTACARYAQSAGLPYLSVGTAERPLAGFGNYFALSESYAQQAPVIAGYIKRTYTPDCTRVLMVAHGNSSLDDAVNAFRRACHGAHVQRVPASDLGGPYGARLCAGITPSYRAVYPLVDPTFFLQMARAARTCAPRYVGVGITMGLDVVADAFCRQGGRSRELRFLSPAPAFADSQRFDSGFERAAESAGIPPDDLGWLLWGMSQSVRQLLEQAGSNLSRHGFIESASNASVSAQGFGRLQFSPSDHFGARAISLLSNICSGGGGHYVTVRANVTGL